MAQEIRSIDVDNDSEEFYINIYQKFGWQLKSSQRIFNQDSHAVGAVTYKNYTYVHTETDTVDFTKLVFERDRKMLNYEEIIELENEFWELAEIVADGRPPMPKNAETLEGWARHFEPDVRTYDDKKKLHIVFGILLGIVLLSPAILSEYLLDELSIDGQILAWIIIISAVTIGFAWFFGNKFARKIALNIALNNKQSLYRGRLEFQYEDVVEQIEMYDQSAERMKNILMSAEDLLET